MRSLLSKNQVPVLSAVLLAAITFIAFWPVTKNEFVNYDDEGYILQNPPVRAGVRWHSLVWALTTDHASNWHPMTWWSHMLDCQLFGVRPGGHHAVSLLFHSINAGLLLLVLYRATRQLGPSLVVAALFAFHPTRVESFAWASERKDVLSTFFLLLTLGAYVRYAETQRVASPANPLAGRPKPFYYILALLWFAFGLMSKPMLVTTPFILLLLDFWPLQRLPTDHPLSWRYLWPIVREKIPFLLLSVASSVVTCWVQHGAMSSLDHLSLTDRLGNCFIAYVRYLNKLFWPVRLAMFYPHPGTWPLWQAIGAFALIAVVSVFIVLQVRRRPYLFVGWAWFLGTLIPVIGLVQVGSQSLADRYTYVPYIGLFLLLAWAAKELVEKWRVHPRITLAVSSAILLVCALRARDQLAHWQNSVTLFTHAISVTQHNVTAHYGLGKEFAKQKRDQEAMEHFNAALELKPDLAELHGEVGLMLARRGEFAEAIGHYRKALEVTPDLGEALNNLAWLLATCPSAQWRDGHEAVRLAQRACEVTHFHRAIFIGTLAAAYAESGEFEKAVRTARKAHDEAEKWGETALAAKNLELMELYRKGEAFRDG